MGYGIPIENPGEEPVPASFELLAGPYQEPELISIAAAYEHAAKVVQIPPTTPATSVPLEAPAHGHDGWPPHHGRGHSQHGR
jgi:hypothetical protein